MKNIKMNFSIIPTKVSQDNSLKAILGQYGLPFKLFEEHFIKISKTKNLPDIKLNIMVDLDSSFRISKKFLISLKNFNLNFIIDQYFFYKEDTNQSFSFVDVFIIYKSYIKINEKYIDNNIFISFKTFIGIIKSYRNEIKKSI